MLRRGTETRVKENLAFKLFLPAKRYRLFIAVTIQLWAQVTDRRYLARLLRHAGLQRCGSRELRQTGDRVLRPGQGAWSEPVSTLHPRPHRPSGAVHGWCRGHGFVHAHHCHHPGHTPDQLEHHRPGPTSAGIACITMTYCAAFSYNSSRGPLPWIYIREIWSSRAREIGVMVGAASQWLFNSMMSQVTPHAIANIGWRMFLMFAIFNYAISGYSWLFLNEVYGVPVIDWMIDRAIGMLTELLIDFETLAGRDAGVLWRQSHWREAYGGCSARGTGEGSHQG